MYQLLYRTQDGKVESVKRLSTGASIPLCEGNTDYQAFLEWNKEQSTPLDLNSVSQAMIDAQAARMEQVKVDVLVNQKMKDIAIEALKKEGKLDANGKVKK
jgi:uncharacterized protein YfeS